MANWSNFPLEFELVVCRSFRNPSNTYLYSWQHVAQHNRPVLLIMWLCQDLGLLDEVVLTTLQYTCFLNQFQPRRSDELNPSDSLPLSPPLKYFTLTSTLAECLAHTHCPFADVRPPIKVHLHNRSPTLPCPNLTFTS